MTATQTRRLRRYSPRQAEPAKQERLIAELLSPPNRELLGEMLGCNLDDAQWTGDTASLISRLCSGGDFYLSTQNGEPVGAAYIYARPPRDGGIIELRLSTDELQSVCRDSFSRYGWRKMHSERPADVDSALDILFGPVGMSARQVLLQGNWVDTIHLELMNPQYADDPGEDIAHGNVRTVNDRRGRTEGNVLRRRVWELYWQRLTDAARSLCGR